MFLDKMPFGAGPETAPKPAGRKKSTMEKLACLPGALVLTGAMALQGQAGCALPELPPMAVDVGMGKKEIFKRQDECREGAYASREILRNPKSSAEARRHAAEANEKFERCYKGLEEGVWDDKTFNEAKVALDLARKAK